jgi:hypothetical protein
MLAKHDLDRFPKLEKDKIKPLDGVTALGKRLCQKKTKILTCINAQARRRQQPEVGVK